MLSKIETGRLDRKDPVLPLSRGKEIHVIADNLSAHKSAAVKDFLKAHPNVRLHVTPTYSSWLNQVELSFAKIEHDVIACGVFTLVADLSRYSLLVPAFGLALAIPAHGIFAAAKLGGLWQRRWESRERRH